MIRSNASVFLPWWQDAEQGPVGQNTSYLNTTYGFCFLAVLVLHWEAAVGVSQ